MVISREQININQIMIRKIINILLSDHSPIVTKGFRISSFQLVKEHSMFCQYNYNISLVYCTNFKHMSDSHVH